jgi:hypothetical protein
MSDLPCTLTENPEIIDAQSPATHRLTADAAGRLRILIELIKFFANQRKQANYWQTQERMDEVCYPAKSQRFNLWPGKV